MGAIEKAVDMLAAAERPIFYTGGGIINSGPEASRLLRGSSLSPARLSPRR
jgi:acetolactate synthase-1/2/3 large subunit